MAISTMAIIDMTHKHPLPNLTLVVLLAVITTQITGCQSLQGLFNSNSAAEQQAITDKLTSFNINGKIGVVDKINNQSGSAFYGWAQEQDRFTIEMQGALGIGHTLITYDGVDASLTNEQVGTITAKTPEELLQSSTGWQAPISQLPYWISGRSAPSDSSKKLDDKQRLLEAKNGLWTAKFSYIDESILPQKITNHYRLQEDNSYDTKVILTIMHNQ